MFCHSHPGICLGYHAVAADNVNMIGIFDFLLQLGGRLTDTFLECESPFGVAKLVPLFSAQYEGKIKS